MNDLRHAWRAIARMPIVAAVVVLSLGIGIGVNTAVFSWVQAVVLRPLPGVRGSGSLYLVEPRTDSGSYPGASWPEFVDVRDRLSSFDDVVAFRMVPFSIGERGRVERAFGLLVSGNYFAALGLQPSLGRFFTTSEAQQPGSDPVVVVSHDYWKSHLAGDAAAVGRALRVNDRVLTIIGVAPERFQGTVLGLDFDLWVPATMAPALVAGSSELQDRTLRGYSMLGRLRPGRSRAQAQAEVDTAMRDLARAYPEASAKVNGEVLPFWQAPAGPQRMLATALFVLQGVMLLLLFAVCGNTANLMLARASVRQREFGVRLALGAGRRRILQLLLAENVSLGAAGGALGLVIAGWATNALRAVPVIGAFPIRFQTDLDLLSVAFAVTLAVACGVAFGLAPAVQLADLDPHAAMRSETGTRGRVGLRNLLMGVEAAVALLVLLAAGMFVRSFAEARDVDPGFRRDGVLLAAYDASSIQKSAAESREFARRVVERLRAVPEVESAAIASSVPLDLHGLPQRSFTVEGRVSGDGRPDRALTNTVTPDYFAALGIAFVAGRTFVDLADTTAPPQAVVNEAFVRRYVPSAQVIGRRIQTRGGDFVIAGVVKTTISNGFGEPPLPVIYLSYRDRPAPRGEIHVRARSGSESLLAPDVERIVRDLEPTLPVYDVRTLNEHIEKNLFLRRIPARMFVVLGPALLLLAAMGIYAVVAYAVASRTAEIGVRLALGATRRRVVGEIVRDTLRVAGGGAAVAWLIAMLIKVHLVPGPVSLAIFGGVPAVLLGVAAAASWLPAHRAASMDPVTALRHE